MSSRNLPGQVLAYGSARDEQADGQAKALLGEGESTRLRLEGEAQADVLRQQIESYGDPPAVCLVAGIQTSGRQPLVPEQMFVTGSGGDAAATDQGPLGTLIGLLVAEKVGFELPVRGANGAASAATDPE